MPMPSAIGASRSPPCIAVLNERSNVDTHKKLKWDLPLVVVWVVLLMYFLKRLASLVPSKRGQPYSCVMAWLSCRISCSLLRSAIMCLRGARYSRGSPAGDAIALGPEGQVLCNCCDLV